MSACCPAFECAAVQQFNEKKATEELKRYRTKGPGPTARLLQEGLARAGTLSGTLLDIGSGIGSLTFGLLERGIASESRWKGPETMTWRQTCSVMVTTVLVFTVARTTAKPMELKSRKPLQTRGSATSIRLRHRNGRRPGFRRCTGVCRAHA
jgi:hypothetical protein